MNRIKLNARRLFRRLSSSSRKWLKRQLIPPSSLKTSRLVLCRDKLHCSNSVCVSVIENGDLNFSIKNACVCVWESTSIHPSVISHQFPIHCIASVRCTVLFCLEEASLQPFSNCYAVSTMGHFRKPFSKSEVTIINFGSLKLCFLKTCVVADMINKYLHTLVACGE